MIHSITLLIILRVIDYAIFIGRLFERFLLVIRFARVTMPELLVFFSIPPVLRNSLVRIFNSKNKFLSRAQFLYALSLSYRHRKKEKFRSIPLYSARLAFCLYHHTLIRYTQFSVMQISRFSQPLISLIEFSIYLHTGFFFKLNLLIPFRLK